MYCKHILPARNGLGKNIWNTLFKTESEPEKTNLHDSDKCGEKSVKLCWYNMHATDQHAL